MKFNFLSVAAAAAVVALASCSGGAPTPKSMKDAAPKTEIDSISYYYGDMLMMQYQQISQQDTTLKTEAARQAFLQGYVAALNMAQGKDEAYNAGMMLGLQMGMQQAMMKKELGIELNTALTSASFAYALKNDSLSAKNDGMMYINDKLKKLQDEKIKKSTAAAAKKLNSYTSKGYKKVGENVVGKTTTQGTGAAVKDGDRLSVKINAKDANGKALSAPMPTEIMVGQTFGPDSPLTGALKTMKIGDTTSFVLPAAAMFNGGQSQFGLGDEDLVIFDVTVEGLAPEKEGGKQQLQVAPAAPANDDAKATKGDSKASKGDSKDKVKAPAKKK